MKLLETENKNTNESLDMMKLNIQEVIGSMLTIGNGVIDKVVYH